MLGMIKEFAMKTVIYDIYEYFYRAGNVFFEDRIIQSWLKNGEKIPVPHAVKRQMLQDVVKRNSIKVFVETGTYKGYMIDPLKYIVEKIYSIEIDNFLADKAQSRFKKNRNITIINGDSAAEIPDIVKKLEKPALFWLDAHFSGGITGKGDEDSPLKKELKFIKDNAPAGSIIAIDDIADCNGQNGYPLLDEIISLSDKHELKSNIAVIYL